MKKSKITLLNAEFKDLMEKMLLDDGELTPTIGIIAEKPDADDEKTRDHLMICPLPQSLLESSKSKAFLMEDVLPKMGEKLLSDKFQIVGVIFAYLGLVRTVPKDAIGDKPVEKVTKEDIEHVKPKEILFLHYQSDVDSVITSYNVNRKGMAVNPEGEIVDIIKLTKNREMSMKVEDATYVGGSLSNIYEQVTKNIK